MITVHEISYSDLFLVPPFGKLQMFNRTAWKYSDRLRSLIFFYFAWAKLLSFKLFCQNKVTGREFEQKTITLITTFVNNFRLRKVIKRRCVYKY